MKKQFVIMIIIFSTIGACAQHDHKAHASNSQEEGTVSFTDENLNTAYMHYLHLKDALVSSNAGEAKKAAGELQKSLARLSNGTKGAEEAEKISASSDIEVQRASFSSLSNELTTLVKASKLASGSLYLEYCPMANNNQGAFWLSNEKEIRNPYFGDMMLKCGSIKETLR
jgi:hypothetical protein